MKKAAVVVDDWKLPIFRKVLEDAGFTYKDAGEFAVGTTILHVPYEPKDFNRLEAAISKAQTLCERSKS